MGGSAFPDLTVPRLPPAEYTILRDQCIKITQQFYRDVVCPPESPGKLDHGDVDLLVSRPLRDFDSAELRKALGAIRSAGSRITTNFAVPLLERPEEYAQVDVHVCPEGYLDWEIWMSGWGDLIQIVGVLNRPIGLTMNDRGLFIRVPEVESSNRKASMLFLTRDPNEIMKFLGLNGEKYHGGFQTTEEMFVWCAEGRFYTGPRATNEGETANDRLRIKKRPVFGDFLTQWAPAHANVWLGKDISREEVLELAIQAFGVSAEYEAILGIWKLQQERDRKLGLIKGVIPEENDRRLKDTMRGLKRWVGFSENGRPVLKPENEPNHLAINQDDWLDMVREDRLEEVLAWVKANHGELRRREKHWSGTKQ
jgi:hypothetical protein